MNKGKRWKLYYAGKMGIYSVISYCAPSSNARHCPSNVRHLASHGRHLLSNVRQQDKICRR